ncbi:MAG: iron chelate uptake ABC transporter family permease subunit, partial [Thermodesulfobacteriota bacterium]
MISPWKVVMVTASLSILLMVIMTASILNGSVDIGTKDLLEIFMGGGEITARTIILNIRLPRVVMAGIVGAGLATAGVAFQALLKNPLAEPYILGVSSGSAVGVILAMMTGLISEWFLPLASFSGGL